MLFTQEICSIPFRTFIQVRNTIQANVSKKFISLYAGKQQQWGSSDPTLYGWCCFNILSLRFIQQSMLFPALLLTTISLLGFYLPPDTGERIGLQITIMLTFMVRTQKDNF